MTCDIWYVTHYMWHMAHDILHVTHDKRHMAYNTWHVTGGGRGTFCSKFQLPLSSVWITKLTDFTYWLGPLGRISLRITMLSACFRIYVGSSPFFFFFIHLPWSPIFHASHWPSPSPFFADALFFYILSPPKKSSLCKELFYTDNDFHPNLGFTLPTQPMVSPLNLDKTGLSP